MLFHFGVCFFLFFSIVVVLKSIFKRAPGSFGSAASSGKTAYCEESVFICIFLFFFFCFLLFRVSRSSCDVSAGWAPRHGRPPRHYWTCEYRSSLGATKRKNTTADIYFLCLNLKTDSLFFFVVLLSNSRFTPAVCRYFCAA